jgi:hypothetical protein
VGVRGLGRLVVHLASGGSVALAGQPTPDDIIAAIKPCCGCDTELRMKLACFVWECVVKPEPGSEQEMCAKQQEMLEIVAEM